MLVCTLDDIHYLEYRGELTLDIYEVDEEGIPTRHVRTTLEEGIREESLWGQARSILRTTLHPYGPYVCICGTSFDDWEDVLYHTLMTRCDNCRTPKLFMEIRNHDGLCYDCSDHEDEEGGDGSLRDDAA